MFLYCLGEEADDILISTNIVDEERKSILRFCLMAILKSTRMFSERACFNRRKQEGETVGYFYLQLVPVLRRLSVRNELIRDRPIGSRNS